RASSVDRSIERVLTYGPGRARLSLEDVQDRLREQVVQPEHEGGEHHYRYQDDDEVGHELLPRRPVHLLELLTNLLQELAARDALLALLDRGPPWRGRRALARLLPSHQPLGLPVHLTPLQGRRDSNPQPPVL